MCPILCAVLFGVRLDHLTVGPHSFPQHDALSLHHEDVQYVLALPGDTYMEERKMVGMEKNNTKGRNDRRDICSSPLQLDICSSARFTFASGPFCAATTVINHDFSVNIGTNGITGKDLGEVTQFVMLPPYLLSCKDKIKEQV